MWRKELWRESSLQLGLEGKSSEAANLGLGSSRSNAEWLSRISKRRHVQQTRPHKWSFFTRKKYIHQGTVSLLWFESYLNNHLSPTYFPTLNKYYYLTLKTLYQIDRVFRVIAIPISNQAFIANLEIPLTVFYHNK